MCLTCCDLFPPTKGTHTALVGHNGCGWTHKELELVTIPKAAQEK